MMLRIFVSGVMVKIVVNSDVTNYDIPMSILTIMILMQLWWLWWLIIMIMMINYDDCDD